MHIHILGIGGTFMAGIAALAKAKGHAVTGSDKPLYPPMSDQLAALDIPVYIFEDDFSLEALAPDLILVGNAMSRGHPQVEALMNSGLAFYSGPQWLFENVLKNKQVFAVCGTHGKTTTTSLLAWILEVGGLAPGFLVGGIPENFGISARLGNGNCFVIEADEYDTAFFDKRPKFLHYHPHTLLMNHIEFDHSDIYSDLESILKQFHYLMRTLPGKGQLIRVAEDNNIDTILAQGKWTPEQVVSIENDAGEWSAQGINPEASEWTLCYQGKPLAKIKWPLIGRYNIENALLAVAAAATLEMPTNKIVQALESFLSVKRRQQHITTVNDIAFYDDFAHHPTAIQKTLQAMKQANPNRRLIAVVDLGTRTMQSGHYDLSQWEAALQNANHVFFYASRPLSWSLPALASRLGSTSSIANTKEALIAGLTGYLNPGDLVCLMSNSALNQIVSTVSKDLAKQTV